MTGDDGWLELGPREAATLLKRVGVDLTIRGNGTVRDLDLSGLNFTHLRLRDQLPALLNMMLPRPLKIDGGRTLRFEDCDFSGLRATWFEPGASRFVRCRFTDMNAKSGRVNAHFVDCTFSGVWEANLSAAAEAADPAAQVVIAGNDFSRLRGLSFQDGVDWTANQFDDADRQLIVTRGGDGWDAVVRIAEETDPHLQMLIASLQGQGPVYFGQDWLLLERDDFEDSTWHALVTALNNRR